MFSYLGSTYLPTFGNQDTFIVAITPSPPPHPTCQCRPNVSAAHSENKKIEADRSYTTLCTELYEPFIHMVQIDKGFSSQLCRKKDRPGKILIYELDITLNTEIFFPAEILENWDVPIKFGWLAGMVVQYKI